MVYAFPENSHNDIRALATPLEAFGSHCCVRPTSGVVQTQSTDFMQMHHIWKTLLASYRESVHAESECIYDFYTCN